MCDICDFLVAWLKALAIAGVKKWKWEVGEEGPRVFESTIRHKDFPPPMSFRVSRSGYPRLEKNELHELHGVQLLKRFSAKFLIFSVKFASSNMQIKNIIFIAC